MIKCGRASGPGLGDVSGVDSGRGVRDGQQRVRSPDSRPKHAVRALTVDGEHILRLQPHFGCDP